MLDKSNPSDMIRGMEINDTDKAAFMRLANALSPENLACDGEASAASIRRVGAALRREWAALERKVGRKVGQDEVWTWVEAAPVGYPPGPLCPKCGETRGTGLHPPDSCR